MVPRPFQDAQGQEVLPHRLRGHRSGGRRERRRRRKEPAESGGGVTRLGLLRPGLTLSRRPVPAKRAALKMAAGAAAAGAPQPPCRNRRAVTTSAGRWRRFFRRCLLPSPPAFGPGPAPFPLRARFRSRREAPPLSPGMSWETARPRRPGRRPRLFFASSPVRAVGRPVPAT